MKKRVISKGFKEEAVRLVQVEGLGIREAATDLGVSQSALRKWVLVPRPESFFIRDAQIWLPV